MIINSTLKKSRITLDKLSRQLEDIATQQKQRDKTLLSALDSKIEGLAVVVNSGFQTMQEHVDNKFASLEGKFTALERGQEDMLLKIG